MAEVTADLFAPAETPLNRPAEPTGTTIPAGRAVTAAHTATISAAANPVNVLEGAST